MHFKGCPTENYSGRYLGILSGNTGQGNDPQNVIETWRTFAGVIPEADLPFDDLIESVDDYYSPRPMLFKHVLKGLKWLRQYEDQPRMGTARTRTREPKADDDGGFETLSARCGGFRLDGG